MTRSQFERHVTDALQTIPARFRDAMQNLVIVIEDDVPDRLVR